MATVKTSERLVFVRPKNPANGIQQSKGNVWRNGHFQNGTPPAARISSAPSMVQNGFSKHVEEKNNSSPSLALLDQLPPPVGLLNSGTSCFFNASLQCLFACTSFTQFLQNLHSYVPKKPNTTDILDMLATHLKLVNMKTKRKVFDVLPLLFAVRKSSKGAIRVNRQEDSHEAMCVLLDMMEKACLTRMGLPATTRVDGTSESTVIHTLFGGSLVTTTTCPGCHHKSPKVESFLQLSLELDAHRTSSVPQLLKKMTEVEKLDAKNLWECEKCKKKVMAERKTTVAKAPNILIIHLKRFGFSFQGGSMKKTKLKTPIVIGSEDLTVESGDGKKVLYQLVGVLVHRGISVNSGHYFAYVKCPGNSFWYEADDEMISRVKSNQVVAEKEAYMLFYTRRDAPQLKLSSAPMSDLSSNSAKNMNGSSTIVERDTPNTMKESESRKGDVPRTSQRDSLDSSILSVTGSDSKVAQVEEEDTPTSNRKSSKNQLFFSKLSQKLFRVGFRSRYERQRLQALQSRNLTSRLRDAFLAVGRFRQGSELESPITEKFDRSGNAHADEEGDESNVSLSALPPVATLVARSKFAENGNAPVDIAANSPPNLSLPHDDHPFSFDIKPIKKKKFDDAWDKHLDKGKVKKVRTLRD